MALGPNDQRPAVRFNVTVRFPMNAIPVTLTSRASP